MRTRRLTAVCMAALMTLTAATGAYALACSQCHETYQGGRDNSAYGRGHHYRQARGCCHGAWRNGGGCAHARCAYAHEACRGYYCDGSHACFDGCVIDGAARRRICQGQGLGILQRGEDKWCRRRVVQVHRARGGHRQAPHLYGRSAELVAVLTLSKLSFAPAALSVVSVWLAHLLCHIARYATQQMDKPASEPQLNAAVDKAKTAPE